ncbi:MAG: thiamine pyrophosphate-binding protein [bacterium]
MGKVHGGRLVVKALRQEGVTHLFTLAGGHLFPIYDACMDAGIRIVDTRHEQAAGHMAEAWSLLTGRMGVCAVTAGPGLTDAVTAVANACQSGSPMLVLGGRSPLSQNDSGPLQDMNQLALMEPITKWARFCHQTHRIPEYIAMAFRHAMTGRPGPVYLEVPLDVLNGEVEESEARFPTQYRSTAMPAGDPRFLEEAARLLAAAERPLILAGTGCLWSGAGPALKAFAEKAGIPVITRTGGRGVLADSHRLALSGFLLSLVGIMSQADVVLALGTRFNFMLMYGRLFPPPVKVIQVDIEPAELGFNRGPDVGIFGDIRLVLEGLAPLVPEQPDRPWAAQAKEMLETSCRETRAAIPLDSYPVHPRRLVEEIREIAGKEAIYVCDGGDIMIWGSEAFPAERPASVVSTGPLGCLGVGMPFALAAKLAHPERPVVLLSGDGTFGLNGMEIDTAVRHNLPVLCVVGNDKAWGMIKHSQEFHYGHDRVCACDLGPVRYDLVAQALGGYGELVERPEEIRPALERALKYGKPACINVLTDPTLPHPVTTFANQSGGF